MQTTELKAPYIVDAEGSYQVFSEIKQVLPMSLQNKIMHIRDEHNKLQWIVGDLFNDIMAYVRANDVQATRPDVANYLLFNLGLDGERSYSAVLIDAAVAGFWPKELREKYSVLPFSHFRFAAGFGTGAAAVLDTAMEFFDRYGRPPTRKWLEKQYHFNTLEMAANAQEPDGELTPSASAYMTGSYGDGPAYTHNPPPTSTANIKYHVQELKKSVVQLPNAGRLVAQIITLCEQVLENL